MKFITKFIALPISTGFGLGYFPKAPGTAGSLLGIPLGLYLLQLSHIESLILCGILIVVFTLLAIPTGKHFGENDSGKIVSDEILGQGITFLGFRHVVQLESIDLGFVTLASPAWWWVLLAFVFFRIFDIFKPFPIRTLDRREHSFFVIADDVVAGLYGTLTLWALAKIFYNNPV